MASLSQKPCLMFPFPHALHPRFTHTASFSFVVNRETLAAYLLGFGNWWLNLVLDLSIGIWRALQLLHSDSRIVDRTGSY